MKIILGSTLADGAAPREIHLPVSGEITRDALLGALAGHVPALAHYQRLCAETGGRIPLLILADGKWVHPGESIGADAVVEVYPPISGG